MKFTNYLRKLNFVCCDDDPCIYYNGDRSIIIALFVDDGAIIGKEKHKMIDILDKLNKEFESTIKDCGNNGVIYFSY